VGWETVIYMVIAAIISIALAPKPPKPKAATLEDFDLPTAEEGRPVPVVFGTVRITGSNVLWYGDLSTQKIKKSSMFGSTTIGYKYFLGIHFGLCHGPIDALTKIECGDKLAWSGSQTANGAISIDQAGLFGGKKKEGGLVGQFDLMLGADAQTANTYLDAQIAGAMPAFRGITGLVWRNVADGGYIGTTPYLKPFAFTVRRALQGWYGGTAWYSAKALIGASMNPAHIVYESITNPEWGLGLPTSVIDTTTFTAAADTLFTEGFGLSLIWNREAKVEDFLQQVLDHIGGLLAFNRSTGKYQITLLRGGYDPGTLPEYGPDEILEVRSYQRQAWGETANELTIKYTDATTLKATSVTVHDLGNIASQGARIPQSLDFPGITDATIAQKVASRELTARSTPLAKVSFAMDRTAWASKQGDLIRLTWPQLGLSQVVLRVFSIRSGTLTEGAIELEAIEDIFGLPSNVYTSQPATGSDPSAPTYEEDPEEEGASVVSATTTAPPGSPADGDSYLVPTGATGVWSTHIGEVATWDADLATWVYTIPAAGTVVTVTSTGGQVQTVTGGTATAYTPVQTTGQVVFGSAISPPALAADQNDYAPTGLATASGLRLSASGAARTITGLTGGVQGRLLLVHNIGALDLTLADEGAGSVAANRFALNIAVTLKTDQSSLLQYDGTSSRWRLIGGTGSTAPITTTLGDLIRRGASADERLPIGTTGQVLTVVTGQPAWAAPPAGGGGGGISGIAQGGNKQPDNPPIAPETFDDEFNGTSLDAKWARDTNFSSGTAPTVTVQSGAVILAAPGSTGPHCYGQAIAGAFKVRAKVAMLSTTIDAASFTSFQQCGLYVSYSTTKRISWHLLSNLSIEIGRWNGVSFATANAYSANLTKEEVEKGVYLEIESDGTTLFFRVSRTGHNGTFFTAATESIASFLGTAPDKVGLMVHPSSALQTRLMSDWIRKVGASYDVQDGNGVLSQDTLIPYVGRSLYPVQPSTPDTLDDEFRTSLDLTTKWTLRAGVAGNATITPHGLRIDGAFIITQPISGSAWQITARLQIQELIADEGMILIFGRTAANLCAYFGGYHRAGSGSYPYFYSATMALSGGWIATTAAASNANPSWLNHSKLMNHRVTLAGGVLTYLIGEDSAPESYRRPHTSNTLAIEALLGGPVDVVGLYHPSTTPAIVEFFRRTA
jgi:hypothetical protein